MKRSRLAAAIRVLLLAGPLLVAAPQAAAADARITLYGFDADGPVADYEIELDGRRLTPDADGALLLTLPEGEYTLTVRRNGRELQLPLRAQPDQLAEVILDLDPTRAAGPGYSIESNLSAAAAATPVAATEKAALSGRIVSVDGKPVSGARVYVSGTPVELVTDADGRYRLELPVGRYSLSVIADGYGTQTLDGVEVLAGEGGTRNVELTPAGLELPEFVVLEPFVEGSLASFVEEKRTTAAVADILGAEQISRAGDSDAAGALKRVTGLTLVDGKYVYVRGLGERYSSVLFNGAQIPSPDPSRRVVPLDLFPTEILQGVLIQKSFSAEMPGEFGGGTIQLRTKTMPEDFFFKASTSVGITDGTSFEDGLRYRGGNRDWLGRDRTRALPDPILAAIAEFGRLRPVTPFTPGLTPAEIEVAGEALAAPGFNTRTQRLGPDQSGTIGIGDSFHFGDDYRVGYLASTRLSHSWDNREEVRRLFSLDGGQLTLGGERERVRTERSTDFSSFLQLGFNIGEHHQLSAVGALLRSSSDETRIDQGFVESAELISRFIKLEWEENELWSRQLLGSHQFPGLADLSVDWVYTRADASRDAPRSVELRYDRVEDVTDRDPFRFSSRSDSNGTSYASLGDASESGDLNLKLPLEFNDRHTLTVDLGGSHLRRERDSSIRRFEFRPSPQGFISNDPNVVFNPPDTVFSPDNIGPRGWVLQEVTRNTDAYVANQALDAAYLTLDYTWADTLRLNLGLRREDNLQEVRTFNLVNPSQIASASRIETSDLLPSVSGTWLIDEQRQLRAIYAETLSRPDFRELSDAPYTDPLLDTETVGNPLLLPSAIQNFDLRYEHYFSSTETASVALFYKGFTDPIERLQLGGTGDVSTFFNVASGKVYGIELDWYRSLGAFDRWIRPLEKAWSGFARVPWDALYLGTNYAKIESSIGLSPETQGIATSLDRPLQGQSPYVFNAQLSWQPEGSGREATLLYNVFGARISAVGTNGRADIYEEPFRQLDFVYGQSLGQGFKMKLRLRNLLDPEARFTQGDQVTRQFRKGREVVLSVEWGL
ncbi:MAG: TonB-dependent receptor [Xanthomonadales bacterium]|jgi:outer membrane receptor protein involved in Fe transport|nr:TonB-dependent receptor [Xanthomonadales bacterium]